MNVSAEIVRKSSFATRLPSVCALDVEVIAARGSDAFAARRQTYTSGVVCARSPATPSASNPDA